MMHYRIGLEPLILHMNQLIDSYMCSINIKNSDFRLFFKAI